MSFFADLLVGGITGAAGGYQQQLKMDEEERRYKEQQAEKAALALQLQQQRSEDLRYRVDQDTAMKAERLAMQGGGNGTGTSRGGGGGASGSFIDSLILNAQTPEEQARAIRYVETRGGQNAAALLADKFYQKPMQDRSMVPDEADVERISNNPMLQRQGAVASTREKGGNLTYDRDEGEASLNRVIAMADPGKFDQYMKGATQVERNDNARKVENGTMTREMAEATQSLINEKGDPNKVDATTENAKIRADAALKAKAMGTSGVGKTAKGITVSPELNGLRRSIASLEKAAAEDGSKGRAELQKNTRYQDLLQQEKRLVKASEDARAAPAAVTSDKYKGFSARVVEKK